MIKRAIGCAAIVLLTGCTKYVTRERAVYAEELALYGQFGLDSARSLRGMLNAYCTCKDGRWVGAECGKAEENAALLERRLPWHLAMSSYNAGITDKDPGQMNTDLGLGCDDGSGDE